MKTEHQSVAVLTLCLLLSCAWVQAAPPVYSQRDSNGQIIFSDAPLVNGQMVRSSYQASYGRPVATASCHGLNKAALAKRAKTLEGTINSAAAEHNVDADLIRAVAQVESCFDQNAISRVGAEGVMQLMPGTAKELGVTNSFNATQNIHGGANYLATMLKRYNQNHQLALAAYNAGPGAVDKHKGVPPYPETQAYIKKVMAAYKERSGG